MKQKPARKIK
jgi:hypothetical protein